MWQTLMTRLLAWSHPNPRQARPSRRPTFRRPRPPSFRPSLDALEDRLTPSGYNFTTIDVPGATSTDVVRSNAAGEIVGRYTVSGVQHGFLYSHGTYTTIDPPGATQTNAFDINARGEIVGYYRAGGPSHAFLFSHGSYTTIDPPGALSAEAEGINGRGQIVGAYQDAGGSHGFLLSGGA
jgi:probable HAF family extracellular repeat protein